MIRNTARELASMGLNQDGKKLLMDHLVFGQTHQFNTTTSNCVKEQKLLQ